VLQINLPQVNNLKLEIISSDPSHCKTGRMCIPPYWKRGEGKEEEWKGKQRDRKR